MKFNKDSPAIKWVKDERAIICLKNNNNIFDQIQKALD